MSKKKEEKNRNPLVPLGEDRFPALNPSSDLHEAMVANLAGGEIRESDLISVPTPTGGGTKWVVPSLSGEEVLPEITGLLVYYTPRGTLWPQEDISHDLPLLVSNDLIKAHKVGGEYGDIDPNELEKHRTEETPGDPTPKFNWQSLPWNQWGTGKKGIGKRCKESRLLFILREGETFPLLFRAQPGSLKTVRPFVMRLPVPFWRAVVSLSLKVVASQGGQDYAQIVPTYVGSVTKEVGDRVKEIYTGPLEKMTKGALDVDRTPE